MGGGGAKGARQRGHEKAGWGLGVGNRGGGNEVCGCVVHAPGFPLTAPSTHHGRHGVVSVGRVVRARGRPGAVHRGGYAVHTPAQTLLAESASVPATCEGSEPGTRADRGIR